MADREELAGSTVVIVGVGLLGGSLGLALAGVTARRIGVVEPGDSAAAEDALARGVVDEVLTVDAAVPEGDVVVLATPVRTTIELMAPVARLARARAAVTDVGSTKAAVAAAMHEAAAARAEVSWCPGHPMAGGTGGLADARADLFRHCDWLLCAPDDGHPPRIVLEMVAAVGASACVVDPVAHDEQLALVSHLPYVAAQALAHVAGERTRHAARGWRGATRLATGDVTMWHDVLLTNGTDVAAALRTLAGELETAAHRIEAASAVDASEYEVAALGAWLTEGRSFARRTARRRRA